MIYYVFLLLPDLIPVAKVVGVKFDSVAVGDAGLSPAC